MDIIKKTARLMFEKNPYAALSRHPDCLEWSVSRGYVGLDGNITPDGFRFVCDVKERMDKLSAGVPIKEKYSASNEIPQNLEFTPISEIVDCFYSDGLMLFTKKSSLRKKYKNTEFSFFDVVSKKRKDVIKELLSGPWESTTPGIWQYHFVEDISLVWVVGNMFSVKSEYYDTAIRFGARNFKYKQMPGGAFILRASKPGGSLVALIGEKKTNLEKPLHTAGSGATRRRDIPRPGPGQDGQAVANFSVATSEVEGQIHRGKTGAHRMTSDRRVRTPRGSLRPIP